MKGFKLFKKQIDQIKVKIENEMSYPGTIKVTVVRETKAIGVAK